VTVPLKFSIAKQQVQSEIKEMTLTEAQNKRIQDYIGTATASIDADNHLSEGVVIEVMMSHYPDSVYLAPGLQLGPVTVDAGKLDSGGRVVASSQRRSEIGLIQKDFEFFNAEQIYSGVQLSWKSSQGRFITVYAQDYLDVHATCSIQVTADAK
jgi:hypothetical protein